MPWIGSPYRKKVALETLDVNSCWAVPEWGRMGDALRNPPQSLNFKSIDSTYLIAAT